MYANLIRKTIVINSFFKKFNLYIVSVLLIIIFIGMACSSGGAGQNPESQGNISELATSLEEEKLINENNDSDISNNKKESREDSSVDNPDVAEGAEVIVDTLNNKKEGREDEINNLDVTEGAEVIVADISSGDATVRLPVAEGVNEKKYLIKGSHCNANRIFVLSDSLIDDYTSIELRCSGQENSYMSVVSDGEKWAVISSSSELVGSRLKSVTGDFLEEVESFKDLVFTSGSGLYKEPTAQQCEDFKELANYIKIGDYIAAEMAAGILNYELILFEDSRVLRTFLLMREVLSNGSVLNGWGSYAFYPFGEINALIEINHPRHDTNTPEVGARVFLSSGARGFLMSGAHRHCNGYPNKSDVAHLEKSIFQEVHKSWGEDEKTLVYSIHGYHGATKNFPDPNDVVLSNGDKNVSTEVIDLDSRFDEAGYISYVYNLLDTFSSINVKVNTYMNQTEPGGTFSPLGGRTNEQGIYSRSIGSTFIHVELEQSIRFDENNRIITAEKISDSIKNHFKL